MKVREMFIICASNITKQVHRFNTNSKPFFLHLPSTSSSLKCRYSAGCNSSTTRACTFTLRYSHTPGLGRTARATHGGKTMASYNIEIRKSTKQKKTPRIIAKTSPIFKAQMLVTCVDLKTSPKAPSVSFCLFSSGISSNSAMTWWCCRMPLPLASILSKFHNILSVTLLLPQHIHSRTFTTFKDRTHTNTN